MQSSCLELEEERKIVEGTRMQKLHRVRKKKMSSGNKDAEQLLRVKGEKKS